MARKRKPSLTPPRVLRASWSLENANQLREDMGPGRRRYIDVVERVAAIDKGGPDPGEFEDLGTPESELIESMAKEMAAEIGAEVEKATERPVRGMRKQGRGPKCRTRRK